MAVHRLICRWDFAFRPVLMDSPGAVYDALGGGEAWAELQETTRHNYTVKKLDEDGTRYRTFTVTPTSLAFSAEWRAGLSTAKMATNADVLQLFKWLDDAKRLAGLSVLKRAGLRFFELGNISGQVAPESADGKGNDRPRALLAKFIEAGCGGSAVSKAIADTAGETLDVMWRQAGRHADGGKYFVSCGPFGDDEKSKYFEGIHEGWTDPSGNDFVVDSDFADFDFELKASSKNWATPLIERHSKMISALRASIQGPDDDTHRT